MPCSRRQSRGHISPHCHTENRCKVAGGVFCLSCSLDVCMEEGAIRMNWSKHGISIAVHGARSLMSKISVVSQPAFRDNTRRGSCRRKLTEPPLLHAADRGSCIPCSIIVATILRRKAFFSMRLRLAPGDIIIWRQMSRTVRLLQHPLGSIS